MRMWAQHAVDHGLEGATSRITQAATAQMCFKQLQNGTQLTTAGGCLLDPVQ